VVPPSKDGMGFILVKGAGVYMYIYICIFKKKFMSFISLFVKGVHVYM